MPRKSTVNELQQDEAATASSPLRRSSRILSGNTGNGTPAGVTTRRTSQTAEADPPARVTRARRTSTASTTQSNEDSSESKATKAKQGSPTETTAPARRGRKPSVTSESTDKDETTQSKPVRTRRNSRANSEDKDEDKNVKTAPVRARRVSANIEPETELKLAPKTPSTPTRRTRAAKSAADVDDVSEEAKKPVGRGRRRSSVNQAEETASDEVKPAARRGRRPSADSVANAAPKTPGRPTRRRSSTNVESEEAQGSPQGDSPVAIKEISVRVTPLKKRKLVEIVEAELDLSIINESSDGLMSTSKNDTSLKETMEEQMGDLPEKSGNATPQNVAVGVSPSTPNKAGHNADNDGLDEELATKAAPQKEPFNVAVELSSRKTLSPLNKVGHSAENGGFDEELGKKATPQKEAFDVAVELSSRKTLSPLNKVGHSSENGGFDEELGKKATPQKEPFDVSVELSPRQTLSPPNKAGHSAENGGLDEELGKKATPQKELFNVAVGLSSRQTLSPPNKAGHSAENGGLDEQLAKKATPQKEPFDVSVELSPRKKTLSPPSTTSNKVEFTAENDGPDEQLAKSATPQKESILEPKNVTPRRSRHLIENNAESKPQAPLISPGSDSSFRFHLSSVSLSGSVRESTQEDILNASKESNDSNKENEAKNTLGKSPVIPLHEPIVAVSRISNVFKPNQKECSFMEPMDVDDSSILNDSSVIFNRKAPKPFTDTADEDVHRPSCTETEGSDNLVIEETDETVDMTVKFNARKSDGNNKINVVLSRNSSSPISARRRSRKSKSPLPEAASTDSEAEDEGRLRIRRSKSKSTTPSPAKSDKCDPTQSELKHSESTHYDFDLPSDDCDEDLAEAKTSESLDENVVSQPPSAPSPGHQESLKSDLIAGDSSTLHREIGAAENSLPTAPTDEDAPKTTASPAANEKNEFKDVVSDDFGSSLVKAPEDDGNRECSEADELNGTREQVVVQKMCMKEEKLAIDPSQEEQSKSSKSRPSLDDFATAKLTQYIKSKAKDVEESSSEADSDENESENEYSEFIDGMAEEGEEDTPSEDSNQIIDEGESVGFSDSTRDDSDDDYDPDDSFICEDEESGLLSGDEYDLGNEKKKKPSRIIDPDTLGDDDIIQLPKRKHNEEKPKKKSRIIKVADSSSDENEGEADNETKEESHNIIVIEEDSKVEDNTCLQGAEISDGVVFVEDSEIIDEPNNSESASPQKKPRKSSLSIQENIVLDGEKDPMISKRINSLVESFCSTVKKGEISLNLSLEFEDLPEPSSAKTESVNILSDIKINLGAHAADENDQDNFKAPVTDLRQILTENRLKRRLSKSLSELVDEHKSAKKRKKNRKPKKSSSEDKLHKNNAAAPSSFGLMNQLITDVKSRPKRVPKPTTIVSGAGDSWTVTRISNLKPSTTPVTREEMMKIPPRLHPKDFKNQLLSDPTRVRRTETKTLLKMKGAYV